MVLVLAVSGCSLRPAELSVKQQWDNAIRNFAAIPIYPMREDVYVGSIRISSTKYDRFSLGSRSLGMSTGLTKNLNTSEGQKPSYPATNAASTSTWGANPTDKINPTIWVQPTHGGNLEFDKGQNKLRLRLAAFPDLSIVRTRDSDLNGGLSTGAFGGLFAAQSRSTGMVSVDLEGVETLEISDLSAFSELQTDLIDPLLRGADATKQAAFCASAANLDDPSLKTIQLSIVTRVFYARGIKYKFSDDTSFAAGVSAVLNEIPPTVEQMLENRVAAGDGTVPEQVANSNAAEGASTASDAEKIKALAKYFQQNKDTLTLHKYFSQPLAFAADVLTVDAYKLGLTCEDTPYAKFGGVDESGKPTGDLIGE